MAAQRSLSHLNFSAATAHAAALRTCRYGRSAGFTLIEILVVLAIIASLLALVGPPLFDQVARAEERSQRAQIIDQVAGLAFKSYQTGRPLAFVAQQTLDDGTPIVALPKGWRIEWQTPLTINLLGVCSGGRLAVVTPDGSARQFELIAPFCDEPKEVDSP